MKVLEEHVIQGLLFIIGLMLILILPNHALATINLSNTLSLSIPEISVGWILIIAAPIMSFVIEYNRQKQQKQNTRSINTYKNFNKKVLGVGISIVIIFATLATLL